MNPCPHWPRAGATAQKRHRAPGHPRTRAVPAEETTSIEVELAYDTPPGLEMRSDRTCARDLSLRSIDQLGCAVDSRPRMRFSSHNGPTLPFIAVRMSSRWMGRLLQQRDRRNDCRLCSNRTVERCLDPRWVDRGTSECDEEGKAGFAFSFVLRSSFTAWPCTLAIGV